MDCSCWWVLRPCFTSRKEVCSLPALFHAHEDFLAGSPFFWGSFCLFFLIVWLLTILSPTEFERESVAPSCRAVWLHSSGVCTQLQRSCETSVLRNTGKRPDSWPGKQDQKLVYVVFDLFINGKNRWSVVVWFHEVQNVSWGFKSSPAGTVAPPSLWRKGARKEHALVAWFCFVF